MCKIIEKSLGYKTAIVGSWAQKTYLPDSDIDLTVFHAGNTNWYSPLIDALIHSAIEDKDGEGPNTSRTPINFLKSLLVQCRGIVLQASLCVTEATVQYHTQN